MDKHRKTIKSREGAAMRARCVFWRDSEVGGGRKVESEILSIHEAPLANNSTNKQREPPLLAFVDKKKSAPPKLWGPFLTGKNRTCHQFAAHRYKFANLDEHCFKTMSHKTIVCKYYALQLTFF